MKKYKLIREYPGSDAKGTIAVLLEANHIYKGFRFNYDVRHVENSPGFWEEVVEKDYEILKYHSIENPSIGRTTCNSKLNDTYNIYSVKRLSDGEVFTVGDKAKTVDTNGRHTIRQFRIKQKCFGKNFSGNYTYDGIDRIWIDWEENCGGNWLESTEKVVEKDYQILKTCPIEGTIYSVKRLSDGEIFTVGDTVKMYEHSPIKTIETITTNSIRSTLKEGVWFTYNSGSSHMDHAIKQKPQPIYLTHDGKDIFPEDIVWYVNKENFYHDYIKAYPEVKFNSEIRAYFLTEEEAKKYIIENKPALSIKEFWEITWMPTSGFNKHTYMKNLVKERLNLK